MDQEYTTIQQIKESLIKEWLKVLKQAFEAGAPIQRDEVLTKLFMSKSAP
jgi:SWI/SNF related-matrix-associated actin-dependent regulator of chromatin subfamily C